MTAWDDLRARLDGGEPVTLDEIVRVIATAPLPADLRDAEVRLDAPKRSRGRPRKWTEHEIRTVENLCKRVRFWSQVETADADGYCRPLRMEQVYERVGASLRHRMEGKSVQNLIRSAGESREMRIYRDEDFRRVLRDF
jgi:hypothetical protein